MGRKIGEMLKLNISLKELYLHWNSLKTEGATQILKGL